jgi:hypothetical protein
VRSAGCRWARWTFIASVVVWLQAEGESKVVLARVKISERQAGGASGLQLVLSDGLRVEVSEGFDGATLKRLLAVIEQG